jgi:hypothetical protein
MYHVRVTTALLADAASQCNGKIYIHGAGWDTINAPALPATYTALAVVVVVEAQSDTELEGASFEIKMIDPDGNHAGVSAQGTHSPADEARRMPGLPITASVAVTFPCITFSRAGIHQFVISVNKNELHALKFAVHTAQGDQ